jgi:hypothetical protein
MNEEIMLKEVMKDYERMSVRDSIFKKVEMDD